ncbi:Os02g0824900 [Oryza sativa Japonica Group]|uniref:Os02g0824900 protein n=1 Tax=Oryza sativa subsp. japonica TaxID=39947 RepID=A0A0P0VRF3_ORYSJ|nr:Os02g0824900 [Oryza sativa Japonica Group]
MKNKKGSRRNRNKSAASTGSLPLPVDRLSKLPDDVLLNILDRLNTPDVLVPSSTVLVLSLCLVLFRPTAPWLMQQTMSSVSEAKTSLFTDSAYVST